MKDLNHNNAIFNRTESFYTNIFNNSLTGQVIVNKDLSVITSNQQMSQNFGLKCQKEDTNFGRKFNCAHIGYPSLECDKADYCKQCDIRNTIHELFMKQRSVYGKIVPFTYLNEGISEMKWFRLNGILYPQESTYAILEFTEVTDLIQQIEELSYKLTLDLATGTLNKQCLIKEIQTIQKMGIPSEGFTICMIDFDNFKSINDLCGHLMGDKVLKIFSDMARNHIRAQDILGRYGGEEFIIIFYDYNENQSMEILKVIHKELEDYFDAKQLAVPVTFSAGVVYANIKGGNSIPPYTKLLGDVDKMLYHAKRQGKSRAMCTSGEFKFSDI